MTSSKSSESNNSGGQRMKSRSFQFPNGLPLLASRSKSGGCNPDHARMQGPQFWDMAMRGMERSGEVDVVERQLKNIP